MSEPVDRIAARRPLAPPAGRSLSRQVSIRTVLRAVRDHGAISRAELSRRTGLSKQTTSEVVSDLVDAGWLCEVGQTSGALGRSATTYLLNGTRAHAFGCDLGATKIAMALADLTGEIVLERTVGTDRAGGLAVLDQIADLLAVLAAEARVDPASVLTGAIGVPGAYDRAADRLRQVPNIAGLEAIAIARHFRDRLGIRVTVENDVTIAARGELWAGAVAPDATFAFVAMGSGIGLGIVAEGRVLRGAVGAAGEIASLPLGGNPFDPRTFHCGALESVLSSAALVAQYRALGGRGADNVAQIFARLAEGDAAAATLLDEAARHLALAIVALCAIIDPEVVVTGGSIGSRAELIDRVRAVLQRCTPHPVPIRISKLGARAGMVGAVGAAVETLHETLFQSLWDNT